MNKKPIIICTILAFAISSSYAQNIEFSSFELKENLPNWIGFNLDNLKIDKTLLVDGELNPFYLEADFNGDNFPDIALYVTENENSKKGILIIHGRNLDIHLLGAGGKFGNGGDDFKWMKVWKIYREQIAYKTTFTEDFDIEGSVEVKLKNIAIYVAPSEGTYNLIMWNGEEYEWIHTGD